MTTGPRLASASAGPDCRGQPASTDHSPAHSRQGAPPDARVRRQDARRWLGAELPRPVPQGAALRRARHSASWRVETATPSVPRGAPEPWRAAGQRLRRSRCSPRAHKCLATARQSNRPTRRRQASRRQRSRASARGPGAHRARPAAAGLCGEAMLLALALLAGLALPAPSAGLYFYVTEGQHRCFLEEVPQDTLVVAQYKNPDLIGSIDGQPSHVSAGAAGWRGPRPACGRLKPPVCASQPRVRAPRPSSARPTPRRACA